MGRTPQRIALVEPPYVCWDRSMDRVREGEEEIPGIGTLVLAAVARERGPRVHVVDGKRTGTPIEDVARARRRARARPRRHLGHDDLDPQRRGGSPTA